MINYIRIIENKNYEKDNNKKFRSYNAIKLKLITSDYDG